MTILCLCIVFFNTKKDILKHKFIYKIKKISDQLIRLYWTDDIIS